MANLDQYIDRLVENRSPAAVGQEITSVSVKLPKERADWLKQISKEIGVKYPVLAAAVFEDGCAKLLKVDSKLLKVDSKLPGGDTEAPVDA